jgi:hypothetical protein
LHSISTCFSLYPIKCLFCPWFHSPYSDRWSESASEALTPSVRGCRDVIWSITSNSEVQLRNIIISVNKKRTIFR